MRLRLLALVWLVGSFPAPIDAANEFRWQNPLPQGHTLHDVEFLSESVTIAVGQYGTVLASYTGGTSWEIVTTRLNGIDTHLNRIARIDASTAVAVGNNGRIVKSTDSGVTWTEIASGTASALRDVHFATPIHGMAVGTNVALRTSDGGMTWEPTPLDFTYDLRGVHMLTIDNAIAVGGSFVLRTTNGGDTWDSELLSEMTSARDVDFGSLLDGTISSSSDYVFRTDDGGASWNPLYIGELHSSKAFVEVDYADASSVFLATTVYGAAPQTGPFDTPWGYVTQSSNGGADWQPIAYVPMAIHGVASSPSGAIRLAVGDGGAIVRSTGGSWQQVGGSPEDYLDGTYDASFLDANTGVVAGSSCECHSNQTVFMRTADGGQTWARSLVNNHSARGVAHATPDVLYSVGGLYFGTGATILKSADGGASWSQLWSSPSIQALGGVDFCSSTYGVAVGTGGRVVVIDNDVVSTFQSDVTGYLSVVEFAGSSTTTLVAAGQDGVFANAVARMTRSIDGGQSWSPVDYGSPSFIADIEFVSDMVGFAVGGGGLLIKTEDAGLSWTPVSLSTTANLKSIAFTDPDWGLIVANGGVVHRTFDGGATWDEVVVEPTPLVGRVEYPARGRGFLIGQQLFTIAYEFEAVPTLISSFGAEASSFSVELAWAVRGEANLAEFRIERSDAAGGRTFRDIAGRSRTFRDDSVEPGATYEYVLVAVDRDGAEAYSVPVRATTSKAELVLLPNVPNPFNPSTTIRYILPTRERVRVSVFDISGRLVATLVDREEAPGSYGVEWKGRDAADNQVSSGVYLVRIEAGKQSLSRKMVLLK